MAKQIDLFDGSPSLPPGFRYEAELITAAEERALVSHVRALPFKEFEFHGYTGKRRVISFGWRYDFSARSVEPASEMPAFLDDVRRRAAEFAGLPPDSLAHALVTEYDAGAAIGWHRDKGVFSDVIGISLLAPCTFRLRLARPGGGWERVNLIAEPRSAYLMRGPSRTEWEHSIPAVEALRYSITFRTLKSPGAPRASRTHSPETDAS